MSASNCVEGEPDMIIDDNDLPDPDDIADPVAHNDSEGAFAAMLVEHVLDYERSARSIVMLMISALHHRGRLRCELVEAIEQISTMSPSDLTVAAYESLCLLLAMTNEQKGRR